MVDQATEQKAYSIIKTDFETIVQLSVVPIQLAPSVDTKEKSFAMKNPIKNSNNQLNSVLMS